MLHHHSTWQQLSNPDNAGTCKWMCLAVAAQVGYSNQALHYLDIFQSFQFPPYFLQIGFLLYPLNGGVWELGWKVSICIEAPVTRALTRTDVMMPCVCSCMYSRDLYRRRKGKEHLQSQAVLPDTLTPSSICLLSPWKLGERWITLHSYRLVAGAVNMAPFDQPPPPAALSHTVVESSLLFSG